MKKWLAVMTMAAVMASLTACGSSGSGQTSSARPRRQLKTAPTKERLRELPVRNIRSTTGRLHDRGGDHNQL